MDELRTQQVLINLLTNAIKFSKPHDTVKVDLKYKMVKPQKDQAHI